MAENNPNYNNHNPNFKKKLNYKLYFIYSVVINILLLTFAFYLLSVPLDSKVKDLYKQNQNSYKTLKVIKD
jgi:hypothetical protein